MVVIGTAYDSQETEAAPRLLGVHIVGGDNFIILRASVSDQLRLSLTPSAAWEHIHRANFTVKDPDYQGLALRLRRLHFVSAIVETEIVRILGRLEELSRS